MKVAAEGVETSIQAKLMRIAGCDQLQGWLYSKAVPAGEIGTRLRQAGPSLAQATGTTSRKSIS